jgi:hypothetical protein
MDFRSKEAIGGITFGFLILCWIAYGVLRNIQLSRNHRYTIGVTTGSRTTPKGVRIDFAFSVDNKTYKASKNPDRNSIIDSAGRYYVEFYPDDPSINDILWERIVPSTIIVAPTDGWRSIPE